MKGGIMKAENNVEFELFQKFISEEKCDGLICEMCEFSDVCKQKFESKN